MSALLKRKREAVWLRGAAAVAVGIALSAGGPSALAAPSSGPGARGSEDYIFAFEDAEITQVIREVLGAAGAAYSLDPAVSGRISFRIEQRLTRAQLLAAFEAVLAENGYALIRNGDLITIVPQAKAKSAAAIRRAADGVGNGGYEIVAVPLSYAQPTEVSKALESISGANSLVYANDKLGLLVLGGSGQQLRSALDAIKVFDQSAFEDSKIRWYELNQAQAVTVASELDRIAQGAGLVGVTIVPLRRLNGVIVFARSSGALAELGKWVARLDTPGKEANSTLWVYHPRNTSAEALSRTLNSVLGGQGRGEAPSTAEAVRSPSAPPATEAATTSTAISIGSGENELRVGLDKDTNTLIVFASPARWLQVQRILSEIDRPPRQVQIEASILEVTLGKDFALGVDWRVISKDLTGLTVSSINNRQGSVAEKYPGFSVNYLGDDIQAAVSALGARTAVEVVSAPKIVALDNRPAKLQVGDQVPVVVQSQQSSATASAPLINTIDYRNTGVILTVTPRVTGDDKVLLEVSQEASSVAKTLTSGIDSPTIQQRRFESSLVVQDGGVVALGGLIATTTTTGRSGVPLLKEIPIAGALFRSDTQNRTRTELIVLLKAKIIRDQAASSVALADLVKDMHELQARGLLAPK